ncbi:MAG TPA: hypothetical protein VFH74_02715 [Gaiellales bacterium]|nr:hypothetical protein [Gaiellales bacterium]
MAGVSLLLPGSSLAASLITNPGFEASGSAGTVFSDTLPDLSAWQITSGNYTLSGGVVTSQGFGPSTDLAVVRNAQDYQDGTFSVVTTPLTVAPQETGGAVVRYRDAADFYLCGITKGSVVIQRRLSGTDLVLASAAYTSAVNSSYTLTASATGTQISCKVSGPGGTATATATDGSFTSGAIGVAAINSNPSQLRQMKFSQPSMTATVPQSWSALGALSGRPGLVPDRIAPANSGAAYLQLFGGAGSFSGSSQQTSVAVSPSSSYTLSAAITTDAVSGSAKVLAIQPDGTSTTLGSVSGTTAWTIYSTSFITGAATTTVTIRLQLDGSGRAGFDDLSLTIAPAVALSLSASSVDFGGVDPISSPFVLSPALTATVTSNTTWALSLNGSGDFADGTGKTFPLARMGWRVHGGGAYTAASTTAQTVATGVATATAGTATPIDFQLQVTYADPVSSQPFQTTLTYTATTP